MRQLEIDFRRGLAQIYSAKQTYAFFFKKKKSLIIVIVIVILLEGFSGLRKRIRSLKPVPTAQVSKRDNLSEV